MKNQKIILLVILTALLVPQSSWAQTLMEVEGELNVKGNRIINVQDPLIDQDVATKAYADSVLQSFFLHLAETNIQSFLNTGVSLQILLDLGVSLQSLVDAGVPIQSLLDIGETLQSLLAAGVGPQSLLDGGISPINIINAGVSTADFIGLNYGGGIIFYMQPDGTGLVAASTDESLSTAWGCQGTDIQGAIALSIGTGKPNTMAIVAQQIICSPPPNRAADICNNSTRNGFNDWFLPSFNEVYELYNKIGPGATGSNNNIGGFLLSPYWSSTQTNANDAYAVFFNGAVTFVDPKESNRAVRAIRAF